MISPAAVKLLMWVAVIVIVAYVLDINLGAFAANVIHAVQQAHQANAPTSP